jgi:riboflavin kinase/FMN adenylyltransferase
MILYNDINKFSGTRPVVTVGIFDGVHLGHRFILNRLKEAAMEINGESTLVTLWPHPRTILNQVDDSFSLLNTLEEKIEILEGEGLDNLVLVPFTESFSRLSSCEFIEDYLVNKIGIRHLVVGFNHRFGKDREGDFSKLKECADKFAFGIEEVSSFALEEGEVSSSSIRQYLYDGNVSMASRFLGREYSFTGRVVGGSKLGTSIGFPTANITIPDEYKLIPGNGVYTVSAKLGGETFQGMLNIGTRPTVNDDPMKRTIEVHLLDFDHNIYDEQIKILFVERIRDERKFSGIDDLKVQLLADREKTRAIFRK